MVWDHAKTNLMLWYIDLEVLTDFKHVLISKVMIISSSRALRLIIEIGNSNPQTLFISNCPSIPFISNVFAPKQTSGWDLNFSVMVPPPSTKTGVAVISKFSLILLLCFILNSGSNVSPTPPPFLARRTPNDHGKFRLANLGPIDKGTNLPERMRTECSILPTWGPPARVGRRIILYYLRELSSRTSELYFIIFAKGIWVVPRIWRETHYSYF